MSEAAAIVIRTESPDQPDIVAMLAAGEANSAQLYPADSNHHLPLEALLHPSVRFFVARDAEGRALATGALKTFGDWAEIKQMWVEPEARGRGLSKRMLERIISEAHDVGIATLRLETGVVSHAALALYRSFGFAQRSPFGDYEPDPNCVFMERQI